MAQVDLHGVEPGAHGDRRRPAELADHLVELRPRRPPHAGHGRAAEAGAGGEGRLPVGADVGDQAGVAQLGRDQRALVVDGAAVELAEEGTEVAVLLNQTPFYGESGGQVGDTGTLTGPDGLRIEVRDTQRRLGALVVHLGRVAAGTARVGAFVTAEVAHERRGAIRAHHTATHLLHEALRRRLGAHVAQKGSLNAPDRLRFDVSQPSPIRREDLAAVEAEVNARIRENSPVVTQLTTPEAAVADGAMALFGEKYGDEVRVVSVGSGEGGKRAYSIELCGGTHVTRTGDIGLFRIVSEGGVSAGVRRIEAVTGEAALARVAEAERHLLDAAAALRTSPADLPDRLAALVEDRKRLERQVAELQRKLATGASAAGSEEHGGVKLIARTLADVPARELKKLADAIGQEQGSGVVALVSTAEGKASIVVRVSPDLVADRNAVALVRAASAAVSGRASNM